MSLQKMFLLSSLSLRNEGRVGYKDGMVISWVRI